MSTLIRSITLIGENEIYVSGYFPGTLTIDTFTVSSFGGYDIFIARFDSLGNCIWLKNAGGADADFGAEIASDKSQFIYLTGTIGNHSNVFFDTDTITMTSTDHRYFVAKYDRNGEIIWVRTSSNIGNNVGLSISIKNNSIFVGGCYESLSDFDQISLASSGYEDIFVIKLDTLGGVIWAVSPSESNFSDECLTVSCDSFDNCYISGYYSGTITFDSSISLNCTGQLDCFIAKYSGSGELRWAKKLSSNDQAIGYSIQTDSIGYSYLTGKFRGDATFGSITISSSQNKDLFITKYDSIGNCIGVRNVINSTSKAVFIESSGASYISGQSIDTSIFDSYTILPTYFYSSFWAKLDAFTEIEELQKHSVNSLIIFSNPNQGNCIISMPEEFKNESFLKLLVVDNSGKTIQEIKVTPTDDKIELNFQRRAKGIYTVILGNDKKSYSGKIIIE